MHRIGLKFAAAVLGCLIPAAASAAAPTLINYQGIVNDSTGAPMPDGTYSMRFYIYDDSTAGTTKWVELNPSIQVANGRFNVLLGTYEPLYDTVFAGTDRWLEVLFVDQILVPRTRLVTVPYAHRISSIDGSTGGTVTGDVSISSSSGSNTLEVNNNGMGRGGRFAVNDPGNTNPAILGFSFGSVAGEFFNDGSGNAINATTSGVGRGVEASSAFGTALYGTSGNSGALAIAVHGVLTASDAGLLSSAVYGQNMATDNDGIGVSGTHGGGGWGVYGAADGATGGGVFGLSANGTGVYGITSTGTGVIGLNQSNGSSVYGVHGIIDNTVSGSLAAGVRGENRGTGLTGVGVYGSHAGSGWGVYGKADGSSGRGVYGFSANGYGIQGQSTNGLAGLFTGSRVQMIGGSDASIASSTSGYLVIGETSGPNIVVDNNEIIARDNGAGALLHLQAEGGQVGIGAQGLTVPVGYILGVDGKAIMEEVEVQLSQDWPDYVFADDYDLMPLSELEEHVRTHKHLPGIPSADDMDGQRLALGAMQTKLLEKVEELTLHMLALKKDLDQLTDENAQLRERLNELAGDNR